MMRARVPGVALAFALALASQARTARAAGSLETMAPAVAKALDHVPPGAVVVASALVTDHPAPKGEELAARVAALVAGSLGGTARAHPQPAPLSVARAVTGRAGALVYVQVEIAKGELRVTADLYPVVSNGWDRIRAPAPPPRAHAFVAVPVDAEVRTFLSALTLERAEVHKASHDEGEVLAAACGDVDGDGGMELLLVSRARVALGRIVAGKFAPVRVLPWASLAPRASVPLREPMGTAVIDGPRDGDASDRPRVLRVGTSDRAGVALDATLDARARVILRGMPVAMGERGEGCLAPVPELSAFEGDVVRCSAAARDASALATPPASRFDAVAFEDLVARSGRTTRASAAHEPAGKLRVRLGEASLVMDGAGAQIALADLDQDGELEVITSAPSGDDAITVSSWDGAGEPRARLRIPAPAGVRALAVCPPEEHGAPALIGVVGGEVWIVR